MREYLSSSGLSGSSTAMTPTDPSLLANGHRLWAASKSKHCVGTLVLPPAKQGCLHPLRTLPVLRTTSASSEKPSTRMFSRQDTARFTKLVVKASMGLVLPPCTIPDRRLGIRLGPSMAINLSGACGRGAQPLTLGDFLHGRIVDFPGHSLVGFPFSLRVFQQDASDVYRASPQPFPGMLLYAVRSSKTPDGGTLPVMLKPTAAMSATLTSGWLID